MDKGVKKHVLEQLEEPDELRKHQHHFTVTQPLKPHKTKFMPYPKSKTISGLTISRPIRLYSQKHPLPQ